MNNLKYNSNISPLFIEKVKLKLQKILFFVLMWTIAGAFFTLIELLRNDPGSLKIFMEETITGTPLVIIIMLSTFIVGLVTGIFEVLISEKKYKDLHIGKLILFNALFYLTLYFILFIAGIYVYLILFSNSNISFAEFRVQVLYYFASSHALLSFLIFGSFVIFSLFLLHIRDKFGANIMSSFLSGKYFFPREEKRIFMFLDIKSATTIAEKLGALRYHEFLNDFYHTITYPILYKKGEIYQYVGDEVTVSWSERNGLKNANCIECFSEITKTIKAAEKQFQEKYGVVPEFKAGLHFGNTVAGEIGIIKREIVYSGDTLNTAARIEMMCNPLNEQLLISQELFRLLDIEQKYIITSHGEQLLKGKETKTVLYGVSEKHGKDRVHIVQDN